MLGILLWVDSIAHCEPIYSKTQNSGLMAVVAATARVSGEPAEDRPLGTSAFLGIAL